MSGTVTDPRVIVDTAIGLDWQASEGEADPVAPFSPAQFIVAQSLSRDPDPTYIQPDGSHGSIHRRKEGTRITTQAFKKEIVMFGSRHQILPFIESAMGGQPVASGLGLSGVTLTGAAASSISAVTLTGIRPYHNTSAFQTSPVQSASVFIDLNDTPGFPVTIEVYKDSGLTSLVASGVATSASTITLTEKNNSGLTGTIGISSAVTGTVTARINRINYSFQNQFTRFFRLFYSDQSEVVILSDCVVQAMNFESSESAELLVTVAVMAKRRNPVSSTTLTVPQTSLDLVTYSHDQLTVQKSPLAAGITPVVDEFSMNLENNVNQYIGNSAAPQKLIKRGFVGTGGSMQGEMSDEFAELIADARANTDAGSGFIPVRASYVISSKETRFDMTNVRIRLSEPGFSDEEVEKPNLDYEAHDDGVTDPLAAFVEI